MAQLGSPGVQVNVIDESFYNPAQPGTVPLILFATAQDKTNASGTGVAAGTLAANAGTLYLVTSQKDLTDRFGTPTFQKDASGNAIQGSELSEYGLFSAYSFLGASNSAYVLRANVDLAGIQSKATAPVGNPDNGTYWLDTAKTRLGVFEWNADTETFSSQTVAVLNNTTDVVNTTTYQPKSSIGVVGSYAVVTASESNALWYKNSDANWVAVGSVHTGTAYSNDTLWKATDWASSYPVVTLALISTYSAGNRSIRVGVDDTDFEVIELDGLSTASAIAAKIALDLTSASPIRCKVIDNQIQLFNTEGGTVYIANVTASVLETYFASAAGTYYGPAVQFSSHTRVPEWKANDTSPASTGSVWVKTTEYNSGAKWYVSKFNSDTQLFEAKTTQIFQGFESALLGLDPVGGGTNIAVGTLFANTNFESDGLVNFKLMVRAYSGATTVTSLAQSTNVAFGSANDGTLRIGVSKPGTSAMFTADIVLADTDTLDTFVAKVNSSGLANLSATVNTSNQVTLTHATGGEIYITNVTGTPLTTLKFVDGNSRDVRLFDAPTGSAYTYRASNWASLADYTDSGYLASAVQPNSVPADGTLWYAGYQDQVDIMIHDGTSWKGLQQIYAGARVIVSASTPSKTNRVVGDLWVDSSDQDAYGKNIKRWNNTSKTWDSIDTTDHTSSYGIIFADARWATSGDATEASTIAELAVSDFVDFDAPDPTAYPRDMLLWNTRRSGFNIKQYKRNYIDSNGINTRYDEQPMGGRASVGQEGYLPAYFSDRWVSVSGQDLNQVAYFGRKAQRAYVVGQLKATLNSNQRILDEDNIFFNLVACPGYPELISDMVNLNNSRNGTALVVGDTPMRLDSSANSIVNYGTDYYNSGIDGELGLHTNSDHLAVYYPSGLTTDLTGSNVVVPPSYMMLRTIAISDQRSFQWFAPAGTRRGGVTNASSVGYLKDGSFIPVSLNQGTRDQMATVKINPITNIPGAGLVAFGQYTKTGVNSSLDRINVARLVSYLRRQLGIITKPFLFEPNDKQTRSEIKNVCESLMLDLVSLRGIYDFIVVCDETNNTSSVISNNQLYVDIAIEPVKAVEFIYIPLRLKNVGDIKSRQ